MLTRIIVSVIMAAVMIPFVFLADTVALPILIALLCGTGAFEMIRCLGLNKKYLISVPSILTALSAPVAARLIGKEIFSELYLAVFAFLALYILCYFTFSDDSITLEQAAGAVAETIYITAGFSFLVLICDTENGLFSMLSVFIISWMTDIFAYFTGRFLGKHKLIPKISPKKTVEGAIGGVLFSTAGMALYAFILSKCIDLYSPKFVVFILAGLFGSVVSQAGDLLMSAVKRKKGIKDYGKLFPGHGGVLDRFDSVLAVSVIVYILVNSVGFFDIVQAAA